MWKEGSKGSALEKAESGRVPDISKALGLSPDYPQDLKGPSSVSVSRWDLTQFY